MTGANCIKHGHYRAMPEHFLNMVLIHELGQGDVLIVRLKELGDGCLELQHTLDQTPAILLDALAIVDNREITNTATRGGQPCIGFIFKQPATGHKGSYWKGFYA